MVKRFALVRRFNWSSIGHEMNELSETRSPSSSVGDYLKAVWELAEGSGGSASTKGVAARLSVSSASVSNMFARLQEMGLVRYERYRGAALTGRGREEALRLVRRHRLIETFLLQHLGYDWQEVHEEAERLEHAVSDGFTERLAALLGHPDHDPHGDPIPSAEGTLEVEDSFALNQAVAGQRVRISKVRDEDAAMLDYFGDRNLVPGRRLRVREVRALDGLVTVEDEDAEVYALGEPLARSLFVRDDS
jgi:DtxR family transcriptional regulator, Mn-dependent transcriptional regulator